ncbi:MAG: AraC family transcriptional regulator [Thermoleophilia bacterium]
MAETTHDTVSQVLRGLRLRGAVFYDVRGERSWAGAAPPAGEIAAAVMPGSEHVMEYHVVTRGQAWASVAGGEPVRMGVGDIVVVPHGDPHVVASAPSSRPARPDLDWYRATARDPKPIPVTLTGTGRIAPDAGDDGSLTVVACGFLGCDLRPFNPLIACLPRLMHIPAEGMEGWSVQMVREAVDRSRESRPGSAAVLERLSEMMFVDAVRRYVDRLPDDATGWLAGLRDACVGTALSLIHADPGHPWTGEELGGRVGLSRSALHDRFGRFVGEAPMQYLTRWRMQVAATRLRETSDPVTVIGLELGYGSDAAFSRAFRRVVGCAPSEWRRRHGGA